MCKASKKQVDILQTLCNEFRQKIQSAKHETIFFRDFPRGCCRDASLLLNEFLMSNNLPKSLYCSKEVGELPSHGWLELDGYIMDITADQFDHSIAKVLVTSTK
jgi:hypothetical protein